LGTDVTDTEPKATASGPDPADIEAMVAQFTPADSAMTYTEVHALERTRQLRTADIEAGDEAPDFELPVFDFSTGARVETDEVFHLQSVAANTPVALIFGSYT